MALGVDAGCDGPLYVLALDDRGPPYGKKLGWNGMLSPEETVQMTAARQLIYDGFRAAVAAGLPKENAAIVVDVQFGAAILRDAGAKGYTVACPLEKSDQRELDFEVRHPRVPTPLRQQRRVGQTSPTPRFSHTSRAPVTIATFLSSTLMAIPLVMASNDGHNGNPASKKPALILIGSVFAP